MRIAAENRRAVQVERIAGGGARLAEIEVISVRGKLEIGIIRFRRRDDLGVGVGRNVAQPEAGLARFVHHAQDIFSVRRNRCSLRFRVVGDLRDRIVLQRNRRLAAEQRKHAINRGSCQNNRDPRHQAQLVALRSLDGRRAGGMRRQLHPRSALNPQGSLVRVRTGTGVRRLRWWNRACAFSRTDSIRWLDE